MSKNQKRRDAVVSVLNAGSGIVSAVSALLAVVLILYSGYVLYDSMAIEIGALSSNADLLKYKPSVLSQAAEQPSLAEINPDYRGWITVEDSSIDYPVVQGEDDLYYASHDVNRETSLTGAIYLAAGNKGDFSESYNLLYGHHMDSGSMFGSLDKYRDNEYFRTHRKATLITKDGTVYEVTFFAVVNTDAYENQIYSVGNRMADVLSFLNGNRENDVGIGTTVLNYDSVMAMTTTKILALSTCASADTNGRLVVFGRMTKAADIPTEKPTDTPTDRSTETPTDGPTDTPTDRPTDAPTETPTDGPTDTPTNAPTDAPTNAPTDATATPTQGGSHGGIDPTPTPAPTADAGNKVRLTVIFKDDKGNTVFSNQVFSHTIGDSYYVVAPQLPGYEVSSEILEGTIEKDMTIVVRYTPKTYTVTVKYVFADGTEAAPTYSTEIRTGEPYVIRSRRIAGYKTKQEKITGINPGWDEIYIVDYVPEDIEEYDILEDYETPLMNPGTTDLQIGVCIE